MITRTRLYAALFVLAPAVAAKPGAAQSQGDVAAEFSRWASQNVFELPTGTGTGGIAWIAGLARNASVLGIGESAHDVHDFLTLRTLITRKLIERGRVSAVAMETSLADATAVDAWVAGRESTPPDLQRALSFGFGQESELEQFFQWLRAYNAAHRNHQVHFYGADLPADGGGSLQPALTPVWAYLRKVDPDYARGAVAAIDPVAKQLDARGYEIVGKYGQLSSASRDSLHRSLDALASRFTANKHNYIRRSSTGEFAWTQRLVEVARQTEEAVRTGWNDATNPRDRAMAANIEWITSRQYGRGLVVVWAHNLHISRVPIGGPIFAERGPPVKSMGQYLKERYGDRYVAIGTTFRTGGPDTTSSPDPQSVDAALAALHSPRFGIVIRGAPTRGPVAEWLDSAHPMRGENGYVTVRPRAAFDALMFVDSVRGSIHLR